jgi:hypothetical protein
MQRGQGTAPSPVLFFLPPHFMMLSVISDHRRALHMFTHMLESNGRKEQRQDLLAKGPRTVTMHSGSHT